MQSSGINLEFPAQFGFIVFENRNFPANQQQSENENNIQNLNVIEIINNLLEEENNKTIWNIYQLEDQFQCLHQSVSILNNKIQIDQIKKILSSIQILEINGTVEIEYLLEEIINTVIKIIGQQTENCRIIKISLFILIASPLKQLDYSKSKNEFQKLIDRCENSKIFLEISLCNPNTANGDDKNLKDILQIEEKDLYTYELQDFLNHRELKINQESLINLQNEQQLWSKFLREFKQSLKIVEQENFQLIYYQKTEIDRIISNAQDSYANQFYISDLGPDQNSNPQQLQLNIVEDFLKHLPRALSDLNDCAIIFNKQIYKESVLLMSTIRDLINNDNYQIGLINKIRNLKENLQIKLTEQDVQKKFNADLAFQQFIYVQQYYLETAFEILGTSCLLKENYNFICQEYDKIQLPKLDEQEFEGEKQSKLNNQNKISDYSELKNVDQQQIEKQNSIEIDQELSTQKDQDNQKNQLKKSNSMTENKQKERLPFGENFKRHVVKNYKIMNETIENQKSIFLMMKKLFEFLQKNVNLEEYTKIDLMNFYQELFVYLTERKLKLNREYIESFKLLNENLFNFFDDNQF